MTIPRRICMDKLVPAEQAICAAMLAVEEMPAHKRLTDAVDLLGKARAAVADFVDGVEPAAHPPAEGRGTGTDEADDRVLRGLTLLYRTKARTAPGPHREEAARIVAVLERIAARLASSSGRAAEPPDDHDGFLALREYGAKASKDFAESRRKPGGCTGPGIGSTSGEIKAPCSRCGGSGAVMERCPGPTSSSGGLAAGEGEALPDVTDADIAAVEDAVGYSAGAWDMVAPSSIIAAAWRRLASRASETPDEDRA